MGLTRWASAGLALTVLTGLSLYWTGRPPKGPPKLSKPDSVWNGVIASHTTGVVSRKSKLYVRFSSDVFGPEAEGKPARGVWTLSPAVDGEPVVAGPRELVIVPGSELAAGVFYVGRVKAGGLGGVPAASGDYEFSFQAMPRDFSLTLDGLVRGAGPDEWQVGGTVTTTDAESPDDVEKLLVARFEGEKLPVAWTHPGPKGPQSPLGHPAGSNAHGYVVTGIRRQAQTRMLTLVFDGNAISAERRETRELDVTGAGVFKVTDIRAVQGDGQHVAIYFSDELSPEQSLNGLVTLEPGAFTTRVEGNVLKLFPQSRIVGTATVTLDAKVRNHRLAALGKRESRTLAFPGQKPQLRFVGQGVILPGEEAVSIPFETLNLNAVQVTAFRVYGKNIGQFLQANTLDGERELDRVGRFLWRKTITLPKGPVDHWQKHFFDAGELARQDPGGLFRLHLSFDRAGSAYACGEEAARVPVPAEERLESAEDLRVNDYSSWEGAESYYNPDGSTYSDRDDPCKDAYYRHGGGVRAARNFLASNIGLLAKRDKAGKLLVVATDIRTAKPAGKVAITAFNFQNQAIGSGETDAAGFVTLSPAGKPFYLAASHGAERGYLKVSEGTALPVGHFDVGGEQLQAGLKGFVYGERGVWRPGDEVGLVFILEDKQGAVADGHPATLRLYDPKGQLAETVVNARPVGDFYRFSVRTREDAPTGAWTAKVQLGGSEFAKEVRIETVMPNRLKMALDVGGDAIYAGGEAATATLTSQWLHGAKASGLKADVSVQLDAIPTRFTRSSDHVFDDPARELKSSPRTVFEGELDLSGKATFPVALETEKAAPGMLAAHFVTRVFEPGGAFSSSRETKTVHPYEHYVGLKLPKGDASRNMLLTDVKHQASLAVLDAKGEPLPIGRVKVALYQVSWKWWWEKSGDALPSFETGEHVSPLQEGEVVVRDGRGTWEFEVKHPSWGRYLVRACDSGGHCAGQIVYIDWPGWAGRAQEQSGPGASMLLVQPDKPEYAVGDTASLLLPEATQGEVLLTLENGSRVLKREWVGVGSGAPQVKFEVTPEMTPTVYASVSLIQPHSGKRNDRPVRLYGVVPLKVVDPATVLLPVIASDEEWKPESKARVVVTEAGGRPMTYTLAVVDEGLLGLTAFQTPDPHAHFYRKEGLGVATWDLYDSVINAHGAELDKLLALGGADDASRGARQAQAQRFPPVVRMLGPFQLGAKGSSTHEVQLPPYVGSVRAMVVAGRAGAYGRAQKEVFVRQPLMVQATLPRVVGPGEEMTMPVTAFVMQEGVQDVTVDVDPGSLFTVAGARTQGLAFKGPGEKLAFFSVKSPARIGRGLLRVSAASGPHGARAETALSVRMPNPVTVRRVHGVIEPGGSWEGAVAPHGLPGSGGATLEVSAVPPLDLEERLGSLVRYPHGCAEQTTSAAFPQAVLPGIVTMSEATAKAAEANVRAGLERLRGFQTAGGGFVYWPGAAGEPDGWVTNYIGHFMVEAERRGFTAPGAMRSQWTHFQRNRAQSWAPSASGGGTLEQAYRLFTLALAGEAELGAMNRLRESELGNTARWMLSAAYQLAGVGDAARALVERAGIDPPPGREEGTYPSPLRDQAMILLGAATQGDAVRGKSAADRVSKSLTSKDWFDTHSLAYSLVAMSRLYEGEKAGRELRYELFDGAGRPQLLTSPKAIDTRELERLGREGGRLRVRNPSDRRLYVTLSVKGVPASGTEVNQAEGLELAVRYETPEGLPLDPVRLEQGTEVVAQVTVKNPGATKLENVALTHLAPSGWEIHNTRWTGAGDKAAEGLDYQDVRDDRVYSYLSLGPGESKTVVARFTAAYLGRYYLPAISAEPMYDAATRAVARGRWVHVTRAL
ncbi:MAG: hypothetical protein HY553_07865 [Elusimicrobia bacterium]|nr:hypothetical protein [Elusimicrobiota bacterium]